jgi:hypothetical protein
MHFTHFMRPTSPFGLLWQGLRHPTRFIASACLVFSALPVIANAKEFPTTSPSQLPGSLQELYAREQPNLGEYGHCAAGFDSRTDGLKMALSCSIYVRSSAQGARLAVKLCNERADFLKIKARCSLIVD